MVSRTPRPHITPGKDSVPIVLDAGWAPGVPAHDMKAYGGRGCRRPPNIFCLGGGGGELSLGLNIIVIYF